jgi:hypothetical protein
MQQDNLSPEAEQLFARLREELENRAWAERNAEALTAHGRPIPDSPSERRGPPASSRGTPFAG